MGAKLRLVRRRIGTVQSIAKITRAQELIASSRIVRAQQQLRAAEPYATELTRAVEAVISRSSTINHPRRNRCGNNRQDRYFQADALHDLKLSRLVHSPEP